MYHDPMRQAFTLIELAIVLVILGLLTGGVMVGQSLIHVSELNSLITDYQNYSTAVNTFRVKYHGLPGDLSNATQFFGFAGTTGCVSNSGITTTSTSGACDGNGDRIINSPTAVSTAGEIFQFWTQLSLAGLVEGNYTGLSGPATSSTVAYVGTDTVLGTNAPKAKVTNIGWGVANLNDGSGNFGDANHYYLNYGNTLILGGPVSGTFPSLATLKPEDAWKIDKKLDDAIPGRGKVIAAYFTTCATAPSSSTGKTNYTSPYNLADPKNECALYFPHAF